ncbi:MAG: TRAP transporter large permease subunit, partial [Betaproteobacteria bacterium]|nr:TRAP transporter large permease subunit [Betaproteobacteria bacterium]
VEVLIPISHLVLGDEFVVKPGGRIATDGIIVSGQSSVDNSLITGESAPVEVSPGSRVIGSAMNNNGRIIVRATRIGSDTELARITAMVVFILIGSTVFSLVFQGVDGGLWIEHMLTTMTGNTQVGFLIVVNLFIFFLAFFLDFFEIAFIVIPLLAPVAEKLGIDLIWFGVLLCVNMQTSFMHPPFGFALFYLRSIAPKEVKSSDIYWGAIPWVFLQLCLVAILIFWPGMVTYWLDKEKKVDLENIKIELPLSEEATTKSEEAEDSEKSQEEKDNDLSKLFSTPSSDSNPSDVKK